MCTQPFLQVIHSQDMFYSKSVFEFVAIVPILQLSATTAGVPYVAANASHDSFVRKLRSLDAACVCKTRCSETQYVVLFPQLCCTFSVKKCIRRVEPRKQGPSVRVLNEIDEQDDSDEVEDDLVGSIEQKNFGAVETIHL